MRTVVSLLVLGACLHACAALDVGCGSPVADAAAAVVSHVPVLGRRLAQWMPCHEKAGLRFRGDETNEIKKFSGYAHWRECCVKCKDTLTCVVYTYNVRQGTCRLFNGKDSLSKSRNDNFVSGTLLWRIRLQAQDGTQSGAGDALPVINDGSGAVVVLPGGEGGGSSPTAPSGANDGSGSVVVLPDQGTTSPGSGSGGDSAPVPAPPVDVGKLLEGKVLYGRRVNSYLPCRGNVAASAADCASQCSGNGDCEAFTFVNNFNCGWVGEPTPQGLCYLMADVDGDSVFDAPAGDDFVSGFL